MDIIKDLVLAGLPSEGYPRVGAPYPWTGGTWTDLDVEDNWFMRYLVDFSLESNAAITPSIEERRAQLNQLVDYISTLDRGQLRAFILIFAKEMFDRGEFSTWEID